MKEKNNAHTFLSESLRPSGNCVLLWATEKERDVKLQLGIYTWKYVFMGVSETCLKILQIFIQEKYLITHVAISCS